MYALVLYLLRTDCQLQNRSPLIVFVPSPDPHKDAYHVQVSAFSFTREHLLT